MKNEELKIIFLPVILNVVKNLFRMADFSVRPECVFENNSSEQTIFHF